MKQKICVIGLGYIGLPTATVLANSGYDVLGVDVNKDVVNALNKGQALIEEPYLNEMLEKEVEKGNLRASILPQESDVFIVTVPTPFTKEKKADMSYVIEAIKSIVPYLRKGNIVILESTSPVGTTENLIVPILKETDLEVGKELFLGYSPERVLPGKIIHELINNSRTIGGINKESTDKIKEVYATFVKGELCLTTATTAEMCKLMENTFRDVNIALANELAKICEKVGINAWEVIQLSNNHPRVNLHQPGPGVGGHCLAVDPWFIVEKEPELSKIIRLSRETNDSMPDHVVDRIDEILIDVEENRKITILGVTYKPNIDDIRESPIIEIIDKLKRRGYKISVFDPHANNHTYSQENIYEASKDSDLILLGVNHNEFSNLDFKKIGANMRNKNILDTRNFLSESLEEQGFNYYLLGKSK